MLRFLYSDPPNPSKKEGRNSTMDYSKDISVRIDRLMDKEDSHLKALASVTIGGAFAVHGVRVMDSEKGLFVQMPQRSFKRGEGETEYADVFHPVTAEARTAINEGVMAAYTAKVKELSGEKEHAAKPSPAHKAHKPAPER